MTATTTPLAGEHVPSSDFARLLAQVRDEKLLGSLNYQIKHHLFPSMPSRNLRRARLLVRRFCAENGVSYAETSLVQSYAQALRYLRALRPAAG